MKSTQPCRAAPTGAVGVALQVKELGRQLGFDLVGITTADPPVHAVQFHQWIADGFHGEMAYLARRANERVDPTKVLPGARSVVVVGLNYHTGNAPQPTPAPKDALRFPSGPGPSGGGESEPTIPSPGGERGVGSARIARYARGPGDYHQVMGDRLRSLAEFIGQLGGRARGYIDTGPVLERDLAQRGGIGFIGKHTNLISRALGNWIFLGELLTDLELAPDRPEREYCGTCRRCLDACPTRAIVGPYRLDARLCISYLTIELKGSIPMDLRPQIGDRVFGCDDCLEVCPWNRFARLSPVKEFQRRPLPPLTEYLSWNDARFREFFRDTPMFRLKRRGFLRNVSVALGNIGGVSAVPALERARLDPEPLVREHAAWARDRIAARDGR